VGEFQAWFRSDADCLDYLEWLRWPVGFVCPSCGLAGGWRLGDGRFMCTACKKRTSVTAGTIFDRTRTPLTVWFTAAWMFATSKDGVSAMSLQRSLEIGSYQTAWAMLHRLRSVLVRPSRDRLTGTVEVDETWIGGEEPGLRGRLAGLVKSSVYEGASSIGSSSSVTSTSSSQLGHVPPAPRRRVNRLQSSQRRSSVRSPQSGHS
jgi:transposase-like protein